VRLSATATGILAWSMPLSATAVHTLALAVPSFRTTLALWCAAATRLSSAVTAVHSLFTNLALVHPSRPLFRARLPLVLHPQTLVQHPVCLQAVFALPPTDRHWQIRTTLLILWHVLRIPTLARTPALKPAPHTSTAWLPATMPLRLDVWPSPMSVEHLAVVQELAT
jgi:hypothetical protein